MVRRWSLLARARLLLLAGWAAVLAAIILAGYGAWAARDGYTRADAARQLELANQAFLVGMVNQETGILGYVDTADPVFLQPYVLGRQQVAAALAQLSAGATDPSLNGDLNASRRAAAAWQAWAAERAASVAASGAAPRGGGEAAAGKQLFDAFRNANDRVQTLADARARAAIGEARTGQRVSFGLLLAAGLLLLGIVASFGSMIIAQTLRPVAALAATARELATGKAVRLVPTDRTDELGDLSRALAAWQAAGKDRDHLFALSSDMFAIAGFDGVFKTINPAWEQVTGLTTTELTSKPYLEFVHEDDRAATIAEAARVAAGARVISFRNRYRCKDGSYRWLDWTAVPVAEEQLIYAVARDITAQQAAEDAVRTLNAELRERVAERDRTNKELEAFSYSVSHDLRAPLRAVNGFVRIVLDEHSQNVDAEGRRLLDLIAANAQQMGRLIDDLLQFSRVGRQPLKKERLETTVVARHALQQLEHALQGRTVELAIGELPPSNGDPVLVQQVFVNLIGNAIKYSKGRDPARIEVGWRSAENGEIVYFVKDNGAGFDMRYAHKLFGVFQRLHRSEEYEGTGVGLALVHQIITKHGGRIWPEAAEGRGATFYFTLGGNPPWQAKAA